MPVNQINSSNFPEKDVSKSKKSRETDKTGTKNTSDPKTENSKKTVGDQFSPSKARFSGDVEFAKSELNKLNKSFDSLREIKTKIETGEYNTKEVQEKVGQLVEKDLSSLEHIISFESVSENATNTTPILSEEYKQFLIENPKVVNTVVERIVSDLKKL